VTGKIMPLRERHEHDPGRGSRLLVLAAVRQPEYPPRLHRQPRALAGSLQIVTARRSRGTRYPLY
jgi:hypothetical protein